MTTVEVGRYRVTRRIGKGGMAEVYEAVAPGDSGFERRVAIKRLLESHAGDPSFGRMFLDEARIASQLHHGNIVAVLDYGVEGGYPFQVLEFIDGLDALALLELARTAGLALPVELALAICTDIAHALDHAHRATDAEGRPLGIVHRDVSPANILIAWSGDVKLTDFGIAFARGRLEETAAGLAKGTLLYMAPEQLMRGEVDGRTDLFGLGCVLHLLVAGQSPLATENAMADLVAGASLGLAAGLPDDVRAIVARATRLVRAERFPDAASMAAALGQALAPRMDTDARSRMRAWLAQVRPGVPAPTTGAGRLDALLGVGPVFSGLRATENDRPLAGVTEVPARRPYFWLKAAAAAVPFVVGVGALAFWPRGEPEPAPAPVPARAPVPAPDAAPPPVVVVAPPSVPDASVAREPPRPPVHRTPSRPTVHPEPSEKEYGLVRIGGDGAFRAEIQIDGQRMGLAPKQFNLPVGDHDLVLVKPDGSRVTQRIRVDAANTPSAPVYVHIP